jgi:hypothetical protein
MGAACRVRVHHARVGVRHGRRVLLRLARCGEHQSTCQALFRASHSPSPALPLPRRPCSCARTPPRAWPPLSAEKSSIAATRPASPRFPRPSQVPLYLHREPPPLTRLSSGLSRHCGRPPPELLARCRLLPWPIDRGTPRAEPSDSSIAHGTAGARAAFPRGPPPPVLACRRWPWPQPSASMAKRPRATSAHTASARGRVSQPRSRPAPNRRRQPLLAEAGRFRQLLCFPGEGGRRPSPPVSLSLSRCE